MDDFIPQREIECSSVIEKCLDTIATGIVDN